MSKRQILDTEEVAKLEQLLEEATRSTSEGVIRFIEPASGTLDRAKARQHHLVFGRRGSGKSSLMRKAAADLTVDRRPIAFVDLESFKGHAYPDVLLSVLIKTFGEFAQWLNTAATASANKTSFWNKLFGKKPTRPAFKKVEAKKLADALQSSVAELRDLLFSEDGLSVETKDTSKHTKSDSQKAGVDIEVTNVLNLGTSAGNTNSSAQGRDLTKKYTLDKMGHLHRHILDYQQLFLEMHTLSGGDAYLFLDDFYHIRKKDQAQVIDYFHRIGKGNHLWIKIGTIRHRSRWYVNGDPPVGAKIGDDIGEIDLDQTLERYSNTKTFLGKILNTFLNESGVAARDTFLSDGALNRLVLASGGVTRDFLGILRKSILIARGRGDTSRGPKVGAEDVNGAAGEYDSSKREELSRDTLDESQKLEEELSKIVDFVKNHSNANVFLMDKSLPDDEIAPVEELVDLRLIHRVKASVTVGDRPGKKFEAFMLDVSQYTLNRKKRELVIIEFWMPDSTDEIRRPKLIYKEFDGKNVIKKWSH